MRHDEVVGTLISVLMIACGQIMFKLAARSTRMDGGGWHIVASWLSPAMIGALLISTAATALWVWVLRSASLAVVYPLYALTFVVVPVLDALLFGAAITPRGWMGAGAIVGG